MRTLRDFFAIGGRILGLAGVIVDDREAVPYRRHWNDQPSLDADPRVILHVAIDARFMRCDGAIYTEISFPYEYWREYLEVFREVRPIARVRDASSVPVGWRRADGPQVTFVPITTYVGLWSLLRRAIPVLRDCWKAVRAAECLLLRWGFVGAICWLWAGVQRKRYAVEFTSDAAESLRHVRNIQILGLNHLLASLTGVTCRAMARRAACVSYVSRDAQQLYPSGAPAREWVFSGVQLKPELVTSPRPADAFRRGDMHVVSIGRLEPEKGHAVLVDALHRLIRGPMPRLRATLIGPGREHEALVRRVDELGLSASVQLPGRVEWGSQLWRYLDDADLFVLPSLTEGMPRALIETLARGVPAIGSATGGIREVLGPDELVPPGDAAALAQRMADVLSDPARLAEMSRRGFERASEYSPENMRRRKHAFWTCLVSRATARGRG